MKDNERRVLQAISDYIEGHGVSPTIRDIMENTGITSSSVARYYVDKLIEAGKVTMVPGKARTIQLVAPSRCPYCGRSA